MASKGYRAGGAVPPAPREGRRPDPAPTPTSLLELVSSGRRTVIGRLIVLYDPLLEHWVRRHLGPQRFRIEGDDLLQDIRLALVRELPSVRARDRQGFGAWLRKTVRSRIIDWEKGRGAARRAPGRDPVRLDDTRCPAVAGPAPTPSRVLLGKEEIEQLRLAIEDVPERYRAVLEFIYRRDPRPDELAEFTGKDPEATRQFVRRAIDRLRLALRRRGGLGA